MEIKIMSNRMLEKNITTDLEKYLLKSIIKIPTNTPKNNDLDIINNCRSGGKINKLDSDILFSNKIIIIANKIRGDNDCLSINPGENIPETSPYRELPSVKYIPKKPC